MQKLQQKPTIEQVLHFLKDNRAKSFVLDIETDTTIMVDEKPRSSGAPSSSACWATLLPQLSQMITGRAEDRGVLRRDPEVRHRAVPRRAQPGWRDR